MNLRGIFLFFLFILSASTEALANPLLAVDYGANRTLITRQVVEQRPLATGLTGIDPSAIKLAFAPRSTDTPATVQTTLNWLRQTNGQLLDAQILEALLKNRSVIPEDWKQYTLIYFFGTVFQDEQGERQIAYLRWDGVSWCFNYLPLARAWHTTDRAAYLSQ